MHEAGLLRIPLADTDPGRGVVLFFFIVYAPFFQINIGGSANGFDAYISALFRYSLNAGSLLTLLLNAIRAACM